MGLVLSLVCVGMVSGEVVVLECCVLVYCLIILLFDYVGVLDWKDWWCVVEVGYWVMVEVFEGEK